MTKNTVNETQIGKIVSVKLWKQQCYLKKCRSKNVSVLYPFYCNAKDI